MSFKSIFALSFEVILGLGLFYLFWGGTPWDLIINPRVGMLGPMTIFVFIITYWGITALAIMLAMAAGW